MTNHDLLNGLVDDLDAETDQLQATVADLDDATWHHQTPAEGWTIATQIAHLAWTDEVAALAANSLTGPDGKAAWDTIVLQAMADPTGFVDTSAHALAETAPAELLERWQAAHTGMIGALRDVPDGEKMPWFGPPMSPVSMVTARYMETWAHGLDVYATLGVPYEPTDRIKHVAHIGVRTRNFAFATHELEPPSEEFRIELTAPSGETWTWGPDDAGQRVSGSAYDFCQLVTQRIHRADTDLQVTGADAEQWLSIAQAFAGPPGGGREAAS